MEIQNKIISFFALIIMGHREVLSSKGNLIIPLLFLYSTIFTTKAVFYLNFILKMRGSLWWFFILIQAVSQNVFHHVYWYANVQTSPYRDAQNLIFTLLPDINAPPNITIFWRIPKYVVYHKLSAMQGSISALYKYLNKIYNPT